MTERQKIRFKTWYWGKWVYDGDEGFSLSQPGFELYDEDRHGWQHSEEYKQLAALRLEVSGD